MAELPTKTLRVFAVFLDEPDLEHYGLDIARKARLSGGTIYPALARLETLGWIASRWADLEPGMRYRRRLYRLTDEGRKHARVAAKVRYRQPAYGLGRLVPDA